MSSPVLHARLTPSLRHWGKMMSIFKKYWVCAIALFALAPSFAVGSLLTDKEVILVQTYCHNLSVAEGNIENAISRIKKFLAEDSDPAPFKIYSDADYHFRTRLFQILASAQDALELIREVRVQHVTVLNTNSDETLDETLKISRLQLVNAQAHLAQTYDIFLEFLDREEGTSSKPTHKSAIEAVL